ncbi:kinase-like protein [Ceratobasidium sp. AG-I]|nr:kinase-like protein [Ceratobasidium sp. AG-I]
MGEPLEGHTNWINAVTFSSDGAHIFSSSSDRTICVWDVEKGSREGCRVVLANQRKTSHGSQSVVVSSEMSAVEMFDCLLEHGCVDFTSRMDPSQHSSIATAGGSFGDIWKGKLLNGKQVAIKCLRFHTIAEDRPKGLKRAVREIYLWSKAKHPNVQELMGITMFQERLGMVSLWMENGNLQEYVRKYPEVDRYELVASGVSYLHGIDMVHGDIKALNILVSRDGVAKLSDFDHSILSNCTLAFSATTNVGGGTLRWMATWQAMVGVWKKLKGGTYDSAHETKDYKTRYYNRKGNKKTARSAMRGETELEDKELDFTFAIE